MKFWLCSWNGTAINRRMPKYTHINSSKVVFIWSKNGSLTFTIISTNTAASSISIQQFYIHFPQVFTCACLLSLQIKFSMLSLCNLTVSTKNWVLWSAHLHCMCGAKWKTNKADLDLRVPGISSWFKTAWIFQLLFLLNWCKGWLIFSGKGHSGARLTKSVIPTPWHTQKITMGYRRGKKNPSLFYR